MKLFSVAALLTAVASTANALIVNTPTNVVQCQPILITWDPQGSAGPFFLSVQPGGDPSGVALLSWSGLTGTSFTWSPVTIAAGQSIGLLLRDTTGATSQSAPFTVQAGSTTDCSASSSVSSPAGSSLSTVPGSSSSLVSVSSIPSVTPTTTPTTPTTTTTSTRPSSSLSTPSSVRSSTTSSSPASTSTGSSGGALSNAVNFGSAGFLAALIGAVLA